ncbi:hypothetical protein [Nostoc sp. PCC 7524]|uniref:hypothetical protein n=1 Tax=Nostoc sp. (strain ATCC 29411 / PCC 7524) TaxID=28072 RepID=UPI001181BFF5|nr:hypothetical protein [Nostoc sp. PCC 7524]
MQAITVRRNGDNNIIRWTYQGIRYSLTWGKWNNQLDRARLSICAQIIYQDCLAELLDTSLNKYRLWLSGIVTPNGNGNGHSTVKKLPPITKLLEDRIQENYNDADAALLKLVIKYGKPINTPSNAKEFMKWLSDRGLKDTSKKRYLAILQVIRRDLFGEMEVKVAEKPKPRPFTKNEVDRILHSLKNDPQYHHYYDFILFLFNSGCRTSEAIGLL